MLESGMWNKKRDEIVGFKNTSSTKLLMENEDIMKIIRERLLVEGAITDETAWSGTLEFEIKCGFSLVKWA